MKGRYLNTTYGGYAIGIAGIVGFLPAQQSRKLAFRKIAALQEFYITELNVEKNQLTLMLADKQALANMHRLRSETRQVSFA